MKVQRTTERPEGRSISHTQLSQHCDLKNRWRLEKVGGEGIGIFLLYGRAFHAGIEARSKLRARTNEEAAAMAVSSFRHEISTQRVPISWDDPQELLKDQKTVSAETYGNLSNQGLCEWWLVRQVPLYLERFPDAKVQRSEHRIFVPLTEPWGVQWSRPWSIECWLDREMADGSIHDIKTSQKLWGEGEIRKNRPQALLYMAAYYHFHKRVPTHFEFHVLPRLRGDDGPDLRVQVVRVEWDARAIQNYLDGVVKPRVTMRDRGLYPANPGSALCSPKYCEFWKHCAFGEGTNL